MFTLDLVHSGLDFWKKIQELRNFKGLLIAGCCWMLMDVNMFVKWIFIELNVFMDLFNGSERQFT